MSQVLLLLLLVLLSSTTSTTSSNNTLSPVHVVGQFVLGFTDAAVSDVVWVSSSGEGGGGGGSGGALEDEDAFEVNRLLSNWTLARESEFRVVYKGLDVRGLLLEEAGERHKRSRDEGESDGDMTLYVFREEEDFKILSGGLTSLDLASSVWLVFASNASSLGESASPLLTLESMFFVLEGGDLVREWYRVSQDVPVVKMDYARVSRDGLELLGESQYLWDRREDLGGIAFRTAYVPNAPFVYRGENGTFRGLMYDLALTLTFALNFTMELAATDMYEQPYQPSA